MDSYRRIMSFGETVWRRRCGVLAAFSLLLALSALANDERILIEATLNDKPIRLVFDTGASDMTLFQRTCQRLGIKVTEPPRGGQLAPGEVAVGRTEECDFALGSNRVRTAFRVFELPAFLNMAVDGVIGWRPLRTSTIRIDAAQRTAQWLTNTPPEALGWLKFRLRPQSRILTLEIPGEGGGGGAFTVDTGSPCGVAMAPQRWEAFLAAHPKDPKTLLAGYMPGAGTVVLQEAWGNEVRFGPLVLTDVPVMPSNVAEQGMAGAGFQASLGLAALKRVDLIVDGVFDVAYIRPKNTPASSYEHNRLGAVFVPPDVQGPDLVARVIHGSPAFQAGIRDGDVLLRLGDLDVTKWRTDPTVLPLSRFWEKPPGTKLELTLRRDGKTFTAQPVLRQILGAPPS